MKIVFMGTPEFAGTILKALMDAGHEITAVFTQPDKAKGRSGKTTPSYVGALAEEAGIPTYKPVKLRDPESVAVLKAIPADVFVVAAYGQFLTEEILNIPPMGCINVHGSLLPKYRGASPIQRAIMNGDEETGVTLIRMDKGMDSGDMYASLSLPITDEDDEDSMYKKLASLGAGLLVEKLPEIAAGTLKPVKQAEALVTLAPMLKKEEGLIDFKKTSREIHCLVRGVSVWPGAFTYFQGKTLKIGSVRPASKEETEGAGRLAPGSLYFTGKKLYVKTGDGFLEILLLQPESKKMMAAPDFARGARLAGGEILG